MKTLLILSDTHSTSLKQLPKQVLNKLSEVDLVLHAGDHTEEDFYDELSSACKLYAVHGNMDSQELKHKLPRSLTIEVESVKIGLTHPAEGGLPLGIEKRVISAFKDVDVIVYGHTHRASHSKRDNILLINPGSATGAFPALSKTYAILRVEDEKISFEIIKV